MATQTRSGSAAAQNTATGVISWSGISNVFASDNAYASFTDNGFGQTTYWLEITDFGFAVSGTISGFEVNVECHKAGGSLQFFSIQLMKAGARVGDNIASGDIDNDFQSTDTTLTFGGAANLAGTTWSDADVTGSGFGVALQAYDITASGAVGNIDHVTITVYYTESSDPTIYKVKPNSTDNVVWELAP